MKSATFTSLACLMLSAANVEAIATEVDAQVDMAASAELEHHHVSNPFQIHTSTSGCRQDHPNPIIQRNGSQRAQNNNCSQLMSEVHPDCLTMTINDTANYEMMFRVQHP